MTTTVSSLSVEIGADISGLTRGLSSASNAVSTFAMGLGGGLKSLGEQATSISSSLSGVTQPLSDMLTNGLEAASAFEDVMVQLETFGGLAGEELQAVADLALELGANTKFSATDAANAMLELQKSGMSVEETMTSVKAALDLAAIGNMDMATAAGVVSTTLAQFGLDATDAQMAVDLLAAAANASQADVADMAQALGNVGPVASQFGLSLEDTAASLAVFANNGIEGAEAGTQLKSLLLNLGTNDQAKQRLDELGVSFDDVINGTTDFNTFLAEVNTALAGLTPAEKAAAMKDLAGSFGITGLTALLSAGGISEMKAAMDEAPTAADLAAKSMETFSGKTDGLKGSVETLMITALTPFMDNVLGPMVDKITAVVNQITIWATENPELAQTVATVAFGIAALGIGLGVLGGVATAVGTIFTGLGLIFGAVSAPILAIIAGIGVIAALLPTVLESWGGIFNNLGVILQAVAASVKGELDNIAAGFRTFIRDIEGALLNLQVSAAGAQIALGINVEGNEDFITQATDQLQLMDIAKTLESDINTSLSNGGALQINLPQIAWITSGQANADTGTDILGGLVDQIADPTAIQDALNAALASGDQAAIDALVPLAVELGIDTDELVTQYETSVVDAATSQTFTAPVDVTLTPGAIDASPLLAAIKAKMAESGAAASGSGGGGAMPAAGMIPTAASGGYVTSEGLAYLHANERVLNPDETAAYNSGGRSGGTTIYLTAFGQHPRELLDMTERAASDRGR